MEQYVLMGTVVGAIILLALVLHYVPFVLWLSAKVSGVRLSLLQLFYEFSLPIQYYSNEPFLIPLRHKRKIKRLEQFCRMSVIICACYNANIQTMNVINIANRNLRENDLLFNTE